MAILMKFKNQAETIFQDSTFALQASIPACLNIHRKNTTQLTTIYSLQPIH